VKPGDTLYTRATVIESRASNSRPDLGLVLFRFEMINQADQTVLTQTNWCIFGRRDTRLSLGGGRPTEPAGKERNRGRPESIHPGLAFPAAPPPQGGGQVALPFLDDLSLGHTDELGSFTFTADDIVRFAKAFDPQFFHVDPEAAKSSLFGGLCASGWHTAAVSMKLMTADRNRAATTALRRGERPARLGPSPGFKNLKWLKPVYAGDTVTYRSTVIGTRPSASRPGWGLAFLRNSGMNQHGHEVFSFEGAVFWERSP
jgi:acyl dehydratase